MTDAPAEAKDWKSWRRAIHRHPELGFEEHRTAAEIAACLQSMGIETFEGVGNTGVVGVLRKGNNPASVGLRADIDALPIQEANQFAHRSVIDERFHGCGHDGHSAMLLWAAERLAVDDDIEGSIYFIFQPNEENGLGAIAMIEDGLFDRFPMDAIFGMHNMPGISAGSFAVRAGAMMTFEDTFVITVRGRGGHASMPERCIDPVAVSAEIIQALQTIVSRSIGPMDAGVVSVTEIHTDGARNVIPTEVIIKGDTRGLSDHTQNTIENRMRQIVSGIASAHGAEIRLDYTNEFVVLENSRRETAIAAQVATEVVGAERVDDHCQPASCSEDFARMLRHKPGCYILIGNGTESAGLHNPSYDFNDDLIEVGGRYWTTLARRYLAAA